MTKTCPQCHISFAITQTDLAFYDKLSPRVGEQKIQIPPPSLCPDCRMQRRLSFRNERHLYNRKCDLCHNEMISIYSADKPYTVYCSRCWWSDRWDATTYGRDVDFTRSFFDQIYELSRAVPRINLVASPDAVENNCSYINFAGNSNNCYLTFDADFNQDSYYSNVLKHSRNCMDCSYVKKSELCYECVDAENCYRLFYSRNCTNCADSYFLNNCVGCKNCFGCSNLTRKQYHIFNKPYSKEDYFRLVQELRLGSFSQVQKLISRFSQHADNFPRKYTHQLKTENSTGDYIYNARNCYHCFNIGDSEDLRYCDSLYGARDCMDVSSFGENIEKVYESATVGLNSYNIQFCFYVAGNASDVYYSQECRQVQNCFGCVDLLNKQYCILNRQYSKSEYIQLVSRLIGHMKEKGEWGEFFPVGLSPFGYNETVAQEYFPLSREEVLGINESVEPLQEAALPSGLKWKDESDTTKYYGPAIPIPDDLEECGDDLLKQILPCHHCHRKYKLVPQELRFYRDMHIPIPRKCPDCRHRERMQVRNPRKLWDRKCTKCNSSITTSYAPDRQEIVYCEKCYQEAVY